MKGKSADILQSKMGELQKLFPEIFSENKIDWEKMRVFFDERIEFNDERYMLNWAGKSNAFRVLQQPTTDTLMPEKNESVNFDETGNIFIEGENLTVLKILQKSYFNKIKMIYIDPPYNTGNDNFIYPDKFAESKEEYFQRVGDKDDTGYMTNEGFFRKNSKENGHYHSNWLNMMYPRLFLARNLLRDDGVIFVSIDDNEVHNLRLIMNEIFGEENFVCTIIWQRAFSPINLKKTFSESHDYILCYCKNIDLISIKGLKRNGNSDLRYKNPDNDKRGKWTSTDLSVGPAIKEKIYPIITPNGKKHFPPKGRCWVLTKERFEEFKNDNRIWFGKDGNNAPRIKKFLSEVKERITPMTLWLRDEVGDSQEATRSLKKLFANKSVMDYPKPVKLIIRLCELALEQNDIILDFFSGSGTTAHAVMELNKEDGGNRKFICVQMPEKCDEKSEAYKAGYNTIADIAKERIRRVINKLNGKETEDTNNNKNKNNSLNINFDEVNQADNISNDENITTEKIDLGFKVFKQCESNFKIWRMTNDVDEETLIRELELHTNPVNETAEKENILFELLLKSGITLTADIKYQDKIFFINRNELAIILDEINEKIIETVINNKIQKVLTLDILFNNNDQLKTNTLLQLKDADIKFTVI